MIPVLMDWTRLRQQDAILFGSAGDPRLRTTSPMGLAIEDARDSILRHVAANADLAGHIDPPMKLCKPKIWTG